MKINMNKDFEEAFRGTAWKGMTNRELATAAAAFAAAGLVIVILWKLTGIPINVSVYFGIPVMVPVAAAGIFEYQKTRMLDMAREVLYTFQSGSVAYEAGEYDPIRGHGFTMERKES